MYLFHLDRGLEERSAEVVNKSGSKIISVSSLIGCIKRGSFGSLRLDRFDKDKWSIIIGDKSNIQQEAT